MKTVRPRSGGASFVLCDGCYAPLSRWVWIIPGYIAVWGRCRGCGSWESVRDLRDAKPGGGHGAMVGTCPDCV